MNNRMYDIITEPDEPKNLPKYRIHEASSEDLEDFIDWVKFHRHEWTDEEVDCYANTIEHISDKLSMSGTYTASWLRQISEYLREEREARALCRELAKHNLVAIN